MHKAAETTETTETTGISVRGLRRISRMSKVVSNRAAKRKSAGGAVSEPESKPSKVIFLSPSLILLETPPGTNTSLPVWEALRSQQVDTTWTVNPYSITVHFTPVTSEQGKSTASSQEVSTSGILQPQLVAQNSCVLLPLPLPHSSAQVLPGQPPQTPSPTTSLLLPLPFIINHPQPAKKQIRPILKIPKVPFPDPGALHKGPAPSQFHTKTAPDIEICDDFLLSLCKKGERCGLHHTPFPFHWQLWSVDAHQWVDVPSHSQVLLERLYCDVNQDCICIKDGPHLCSLQFDSMDLDDFSKYDAVRRLTNSDSPVKNPHFPSKMKIYWWNNHEWEEYNKDVSTWLLKKMKEKEPECSFHIGSQEYNLDFTVMIQTNVTTGFKRDVRCRPFYRSPDSMRPHLKTGSLPGHPEPDGDPPGENFNVDPLGEFSSWYPPVWGLVSEEDYSLVDVPAGTVAYRSVQNFFYASLSETEVDIVSIQQVQNLLQWDKYQRHKAYMQKQHRSTDPLERHLFHGTTREAAEVICHNNFDPRVSGLNGASHGFGTYFATVASFSNTFSSRDQSNVRSMFLAKVLVGNVSVGRSGYRRPPPLQSKTRQFSLYDTCVDNVSKPTMFVVFDSCQCYPYYLIRYKDLPKEIMIK